MPLDIVSATSTALLITNVTLLDITRTLLTPKEVSFSRSIFSLSLRDKLILEPIAETLAMFSLPPKALSQAEASTIEFFFLLPKKMTKNTRTATTIKQPAMMMAIKYVGNVELFNKLNFITI